MKRYIKTLIIVCGVTLLSACATKQEAAPDADGAGPAASEAATEAPVEKPAAAPDVEPEPEMAPAPPADADPSLEGPKEEAPAPGELRLDNEASDAAGVEEPKLKGSTNKSKQRLAKPKPADAAPAAKEAPCDPDESEDCDPSLLRKLPGR